MRKFLISLKAAFVIRMEVWRYSNYYRRMKRQNEFLLYK